MVSSCLPWFLLGASTAPTVQTFPRPTDKTVSTEHMFRPDYHSIPPCSDTLPPAPLRRRYQQKACADLITIHFLLVPPHFLSADVFSKCVCVCVCVFVCVCVCERERERERER